MVVVVVVVLTCLTTILKVKGPSAYWTKLSSSAAPIPRYLHSSYGVISSDGSSVEVFIFGGITESGTSAISLTLSFVMMLICITLSSPKIKVRPF